MVLPKAVRLIGTVEKARMVYIEDYVLQYLTICEEEAETEAEMKAGTKEETILYGKKEKDGGTTAYLIYRVYRQTGQDRPEKEFQGKNYNKEYVRLGYMDQETGAIVLDDWGKGENLKGYYVFYDADEKMKEYLGECYERQLRQKKQNNSRPAKIKRNPALERGERSENTPAELVALSNADRERGCSPFLWIRIAVIGIFIVFCAIAVTTVNGFDKLNDFIQTAVLTGEIMESP